MKRRLAFYLHRLRYDSWLMLLLDLGKPFGVAVCPYVLYREHLDPEAEHALSSPPAGVQVRLLRPEDGTAMSRFPDREVSARAAGRRLEQGDLGLGAWAGDMLVGFTWASTKQIHDRLMRSRLSSRQAYLYDAYTAPEWRGRGVAPALRSHLYAALAERKRSELYSMTFSGNRPAHRFKEKLGAERVARGLYVRLFRWRFNWPK